MHNNLQVRGRVRGTRTLQTVCADQGELLRALRHVRAANNHRPRTSERGIHLDLFQVIEVVLLGANGVGRGVRRVQSPGKLASSG